MRKKWDRVVQKLTRLTSEGALQWTRDPKVRREDQEGAAFVVEYLGKRIAVYGYGRLEQNDGEVPGPEFYRSQHAAVEFVSDGGAMEWALPETLSGQALLDAVQFQCSGAEDFLKAALEGEPEPESEGELLDW